MCKTPKNAQKKVFVISLPFSEKSKEPEIRKVLEAAGVPFHIQYEFSFCEFPDEKSLKVLEQLFQNRLLAENSQLTDKNRHD